MPIDEPKHPATYPIWMRATIEAALQHPGKPVFALAFESKRENNLRRRFRAYVKVLRQMPIPQWTEADRAKFLAHRFVLTCPEPGQMELTAWPDHSDQSERLEACTSMSELVDRQKR